MQNYTGYGWEGKNFPLVKNLRQTEIAKMIRSEIKYKYPQIKTSVRSEIYSGGGSIKVWIQETPFEVLTPEYQEWKASQYQSRFDGEQYTEEAKQLQKELETIVNQYRYDDSNVMTDYFSTNFYGFVYFEH